MVYSSISQLPRKRRNSRCSEYRRTNDLDRGRTVPAPIAVRGAVHACGRSGVPERRATALRPSCGTYAGGK